MKHHSFQELVRRVVHLSTRDGRPIPVTWNGTQAYTTKKVVNIPTLPAGTVLTKHQFDVWLGYTIHEGPGHQTYTDLDIYEDECKNKRNPTFSYLLNVFEDVRIENATIRRYPGDRRFLDVVHQFVDDKIPPEQCRDPDILGLIYKEVYVKYRKFNSGRVSGELRSMPIRNALKKLPDCASTLDCANLAAEVLKLLEQEQEFQEQQQQSKDDNHSQNNGGDGQNNEQSENSDNNESGNENGNNQSSSQSQDSSFKNDGQNSDNNRNSGNVNSLSNSEDSENPSNNRPDGRGNSAHDRFDPYAAQNWQALTEIKNAIQKLLDEVKDDNNLPNKGSHTGSTILPPANIAYDRVFVPSGEDMNKFLESRAELAPQILSLKKMFRIYLQSKAQKSWLRGLEEGSLDRDRLFVAATGSNTIFRERHNRPFINTAISMMIDLSSSMDIEKTRAATIVLAEALSSIPQIKLAISGFTTNGRGSSAYDWKLPDNVGRAVGMDILLFKDFDAPYIKSKAKLGAIRKSGMTPLGDAYGKALEQLIPRTEPRKIIFLITDGTPEFPKGSKHSDYLLMEQIKLKAKKLGIETFGFGIGRNVAFLSNYVEKHADITDLSQLPQNLMAALKKIL